MNFVIILTSRCNAYKEGDI